jgi:hypothetical protein
MNAFRQVATALLILAVQAGVAGATPAVGTAKARGDYRPGAWANLSDGGSSYSRGNSYRGFVGPVAPRTMAAPSVSVPSVATAPVETRRLSYAPPVTAAPKSAPVATDHCGRTIAPATLAAPQSRNSYAPVAAPASQASPAASYTPRYSVRGSGRSVELWTLPKTDPRKYGGR